MRSAVSRPVNLRVDPIEPHMNALYYALYAGEKLWALMPARYILQQHLETFAEFPPRQAPAGFNRGEMLERTLKVAAQGL
jgi:hypothetical protein